MSASNVAIALWNGWGALWAMDEPDATEWEANYHGISNVAFALWKREGSVPGEG